jgi:hypothetical protein
MSLIQKALGELIGNEEFSYFNGKEVFVGFKPYLNEINGNPSPGRRNNNSN